MNPRPHRILRGEAPCCAHKRQLSVSNGASPRGAPELHNPAHGDQKVAQPVSGSGTVLSSTAHRWTFPHWTREGLDTPKNRTVSGSQAPSQPQ